MAWLADGNAEQSGGDVAVVFALILVFFDRLQRALGSMRAGLWAVA